MVPEANQRHRNQRKNGNNAKESKTVAQQLLHLVFGGELTEIGGVELKNLDEVDIVGLFPNYKQAYDAWKAASQRTVDNAQMRYFIVHLHKLIDPGQTVPERAPERKAG